MKAPSHRLPKPAEPMPDLEEREENEEEAPAQVFPSLPDSALDRTAGGRRSLGGRQQKPSDREIENDFVRLSLAFKTDRSTLSARLELLRRHRNTAEENAESELKELRSAVETLTRLAPEQASRELLAEVQRRIDVILQSVRRLSGKSEQYGAVQQEERLSRAVEVMTTHVENVRRLREKERAELEETRRLLLETRLLSGEKRDEAALRRSPLVDSGGPSIPAATSRRRASVAGYQRAPPDAWPTLLGRWPGPGPAAPLPVLHPSETREPGNGPSPEEEEGKSRPEEEAVSAPAP